MNQWEEFKRSQEVVARRSLQKDLYICDTCGCSWFELVHLKQYTTLPVIPGQDPAPFNAYEYPFLKCGRCGNLKEHEVTITNPTNKLTKEYTDLLESMKSKNEIPNKG